MRVVVELVPDDGRAPTTEELEELRRQLLERGVHAESLAPTRDVGAVVGVAVEVLATVASVAEIAGYLQDLRDRWPARGRRRLRIAGVDVDSETPPLAVGRAVIARAAPPADGRRSALIVAVGSYDDLALQQLRSPAADADALASVLGDPAVGGYDVDVLADPDERTVRRRVAAFFADREPDDVLVLHFSCHGVKDRRGRLHLAARDTELAALEATSVSAAFLEGQLSLTRARRVLLLLDCCFSGAFSGGLTARADRSVGVLEELAGSGRVVLTASSSTEYAFEGTRLAQEDPTPSVFTAAVVAGLATGAADTDEDGHVTVDELYTFVRRRVRESATGQVPTRSVVDDGAGPFVVASSPRGARLPDDVLQYLTHVDVLYRLDGVRRAEELADDPGGRRVRAAVEALRKVAADDDSARAREAARAALRRLGRAPVVDPDADPAASGRSTSAPPGAPAAARRRPWGARRLSRSPALLVVVAAVVAAVAVLGVVSALRREEGSRGLSSPPASSSPSCGITPVREDFSGDTVGPGWERVRLGRDDVPVGGSLEIHAPEGADVYMEQLRAPMLLRPTGPGDYEVRADVTASPRQFYQGAGLLLWNGSQQYVRLERGFGESGVIVFEYRDRGPHIKVHPPDASSPAVIRTDAARVELRLRKSGDRISAAWRSFGGTWQDLGAITMSLPAYTKAGVAVLNRAQAGAKPAPFEASFDDLSLGCPTG